MKTIIVVLMVLVGVDMIALAPMVNSSIGESMFGITWPLRAGSTQPAQEHKTTTTFARFMQVAGGLMIMVALVIGLVWRTQRAD